VAAPLLTMFFAFDGVTTRIEGLALTAWQTMERGTVVGLACRIAEGRLFVSGASGVATKVLSRFRGHDDVGLGRLLGSNLSTGWWGLECWLAAT